MRSFFFRLLDFLSLSKVGVFRFAIVFGLIGFLFAHDLKGEVIPTQRAISVMKSLEAKFQILQWGVNYRAYKLKDGDDLGSVTEHLFPKLDVEVVIDPISGRYKCKATGTYKWVNGPAPSVSSMESFSFDGAQYRNWKRTRHGQELPIQKEDPAFGVISKDRDDIIDRDYMQSFCLMTGLAYMPPYFWTPEITVQPLSSLLQTWVDKKWEVSVTESKQGVWQIKMPWTDGKFGEINITYNLDKGGIVTKARWSNQEDLDTIRLFVDLKEIDAGVWVPQIIKLVHNRGKHLSILKYKNITINPEVTAETFRSKFPKGCKVEDFIEEKIYYVGTASDRQSQIRQFALEHRITGKSASSSPLGRRTFLALNICIIVILATLYMIRIRRRRAS